MAIENVILGSAPNDGTGDTIRTAFTKVNSNFAQTQSQIAAVQASADAGVANLAATKGAASGITPLNASAQIDDAYFKNSGATAGTYGTSIAVGTFTVDVKGRVTAASSTNIRTATTSVTGIVQLNDTMTSTSTTLAATANAVKKTYDFAGTMIPAAQKGAADGVATLGLDGKVPAAQLNLPKGGQFLGTAETKAIAYNAQTIAENITIPAAYNGLSAGPITINDGYTVTIEDGATWTIV